MSKRTTVAHSRTARKRIRQTAKRTERNRSRISRIRTFVRRVEDAIAKGDAGAASTAFAAAAPELQRGVSKGVLHRNTVARKISRLSSKVRSLNLSAQA
jgi:small subunit ribosomal protein S20